MVKHRWAAATQDYPLTSKLIHLKLLDYFHCYTASSQYNQIRLMKSLECAQSNIVKNVMRFDKRSHHSNLLHAVRIDKVETSVIRWILSLWYRIYQVDNPARVLSNAMLCDDINSRHQIPGTLIHRVMEAGFSPI